MNIIVIGGAGFIGSNLCEILIDKGNRVICVDDFSLGEKSNIKSLMDNPKFVLYEQDAIDFKALNKIFANEKPEYVFHLAANSDIQASANNPYIEYKNTYSTTFNILCCMRENNVKKLFFASTSAVYGNKGSILLDENTPDLKPISYYGAAKLGSEALISAFSYMNDFKSLIFRFPNVIGPKLTHGVIFDFIKKLNFNQSELKILGDGNQTKPYIYISDLIDAILMLMNDNENNVELYNLGVEGATSVRKIADIICDEMQLTDVKYQYTGGECGWKGDVPKFLYNLDKIYKTGWKAKYNSDEAVRKTVKDVLRRNYI